MPDQQPKKKTDGVYEYLFVDPAIPITGAVGSPVNPLAIK